MTALNDKERGDQLYREGKYQEAIDVYKRAVMKGFPEIHKVYSNRCACYLQVGMLNLALDDANTCIRLQPSWAKGFLRKGATLSRLGRIGEAIEAYRKVLELDRNNSEAAAAIARLTQRGGNSSSSGHPMPGGFNLSSTIAAVRDYISQAGFRAMTWWSSLDNSTRQYILFGLAAYAIYFFFFSGPSYRNPYYYDDYSTPYYGLSWTTWGLVMLAAWKVPPMFPQVFGQFALPFFGMNIGTFMWIVNMLSNSTRGGQRGGFYPGYGARRRF